VSLIVVIEDHVQNARMVEKLLTRAGHKVLVAHDGENGLTTIFENQPDLALIDLGLPDIDGQTVIGLIRQQPEYNNLPLIVFTAWPQETAYEMAEKYGCNGVIIKPVDPARFAQQVASFIKKEETDSGIFS
jgi:two-component system, cell cycle response regulator DivK